MTRDTVVYILDIITQRPTCTRASALVLVVASAPMQRPMLLIRLIRKSKNKERNAEHRRKNCIDIKRIAFESAQGNKQENTRAKLLFCYSIVCLIYFKTFDREGTQDSETIYSR